MPRDNCDATIMKATEYFHISSKFKSPSLTKKIMVKWDPPIKPFHKLNMDGSALGNLGEASSGGLILDHTGKWIKGFI